MSELEQAEAVEEVVENSEAVADSAPAQAEESAPDESEVLRKQLAEKAFKEREARRKADELERKLKQLEEKQTPAFDGSIPPMPDPFDDDFESKTKAREEAIRAKAKFDYDEVRRKEEEANAQYEQKRVEAEKQQKLQEDFRKNAESLGVDMSTLSSAADTVLRYGVTPDIEEAILADKHGALVLQHLAANPLVLSDLVDATPYQAGMMMADIRQKALSLKPKPSNAPEPAETLTGRGSPKIEDDFGITYE